MKRLDQIKQNITSFARKQIKLKYHPINTYNYEEVLFTGIKY